MTNITSVVLVLLMFVGCTDAVWTSPITSTEANVEETSDTAVPENASGELSITFTATDAASYNIVSQTPDNVFGISETTGVLSVLTDQQLDYETDESHIVVVSATDNGNSVGTATVTIPILDVNDVAPMFTESSYTVNMADDTEQGTSVITVTATDGDGSSPNNEIESYSIIEGNTDSDFTIDENTGTITVNNVLSAATTNMYALIVEAVDKGIQPLSGSATVNICVGCDNGKDVVWTSPITSTDADAEDTSDTAVPENASGELSITFTATDAASYNIISQTPDNVFSISETTGILSVLTDQQLDYETYESHTVVVSARDNGNTIGTATVTIPISDVNDVAPMFTESSYTVTIPDGSEQGTSVITVTATDGDGSSPNNEIESYSIIGGNTNSDLTINEKTGTITVANKLSAATTAMYTIIVEASDKGSPSLTGSTTVDVCVGCANGEESTMSNPVTASTTDEICEECDNGDGGSCVSSLLLILSSVLIGTILTA